MTRLIHVWMCFVLLALSACDRAARPAERGDKETPPAATRAKRGGRDAAPDPRLNMRTALADARKIPDAMERHKAIAAVVWDAHELDPALATEAFSLLEKDSPDKIQLVQHFAMRLTDQDLQQALDWAHSLESEREIEAARARIALVLADSDPRRAAEMLAESAIESRELDVAIVQVLQHWTAQSPTEAAAWLSVFPPGEFREAGVKTVLSQWAGHAPAEAFAWMDSLADETLRGEALRALKEAYQEQAPHVRAAWLQNATPAVRQQIESSAREASE